MALNLALPVLINAASGALLVLLGLFVASRTKGGRVNLAFGVFAVGLGFDFIGFNLLTRDDPLVVPVLGVGAFLRLLAVVAVFWLALNFPRPLLKREKKLLPLALVFGIATSVTAVISTTSPELAALLSQPEPLQTVTLMDVGAFFVLLGVIWASLVILTGRFLFARREESDYARHVGLMTAALATYPAYLAGNDIGSLRSSGVTTLEYASFYIVFAVVALAVGLMWTWIATRSPHRRTARNISWLILGMMLVGSFLGSSLAPPLGILLGATVGLTRIVTVAFFAYAIVRFQLLEVDLQIKWGIKQSTVAAAFVAVFFVVSEAAQSYFASNLGPYAGVVAAGALVFFLAPLQRLADRVANAAMPGVENTPAYLLKRREDSYTFALRNALANRSISRDEERSLANLAADLGIDAGRAFDLREAVERELAVAAQPTPAGVG
jgi:hypothetical protein